MNKALIKKALQIFDEAMEFDIADRANFVNEVCGRDADLLNEVESMFRHDGGLSFIHSVVEGTSFQWPITVPTGDRYEILDEIARGGMGIIFRAFDATLDREVAIKVLLEDHRGDPHVLQRFYSEARIGAHLQHPGIAPVYDLGCLPDYGPFFAMKLVRGKTFAQVLKHERGNQLDHTRLITIFERLCQTVAFAHSHEIIHRDLKPANVMLGEFGEVQLMDWGIAKLLEPGGVEPLRIIPGTELLEANSARKIPIDPEVSPATRFGLVMGTPDYMPPEQAAGLRDKTTDVFSLGAMLCEILTGKPPYEGPTSAEVLANATRCNTSEAIKRLDQVECDRQLVVVAKKCLETASQDRYPDAALLAAEIAAYQSSTAARTRQAELETARANAITAQAKKSKRLSIALLVSVLALTLSAMTFWSWISYQKSKHATDLARTERDGAVAAKAHAYRSAMTAAFLDVETNRYDRALTLLADTSEQFRNWEWHYLNEYIDQSLVHFDDDISQVEIVQLIPGTDQVLFVDSDSTIRVMDRWTGKQLSRKQFAVGFPLGVSHKGDLVLTEEEQVVLCDVRNGREIQRFDAGICDSSYPSAISPNAKYVAINTSNGILKVFDVRSGQLLKTISGSQCNALFKSDNELVWIEKNLIHAWNIQQDRVPSAPIELESGLGVAQQISLSRNGLYLACRGTEHVQVWNLKSRQSFKIETAIVAGQIAFDQSGNRLNVVLLNGVIQIWDLECQTMEEKLHSSSDVVIWSSSISVEDPFLCTMVAEHPLRKPGGPVNMIRDIRLWHSKGNSVRTLKGHEGFVYPVAFSPDGSRIASGSWDGTIRLWDAMTSQEIAVLAPNRGEIYSLDFDSEGKRIVAGIANGDVLIWDAMTGAMLAQKKFKDRCYSVLFGPDDASLLVSTGGLFELDSKTLAITQTLAPQKSPGQPGFTTEIVFSSDRGRFATMSGKSSWSPNNEVVIWDSKTLTEIETIHTSSLVDTATFSPDGSEVALGHVNGKITIWNLDSLVEPSVLIEGHLRHVFALQYLNENRIVSGGKDGNIFIWDCTTGQQVGFLPGHTGYIYSMALSPDSKRLVSGSEDKTIRIWETLPLSRRLIAMRDSEAIHSSAEKVVLGLLEKQNDFRSVVRRLTCDKTLDESLRREALNVALRFAIDHRRSKSQSGPH